VTNSQGRDAAPAAVSGGKRERLVAAARQMFHEQGVEKTTLAEIAAAASVPAGNVFYYFKTKDALVSAVLGTYGDTLGTLCQTLDQHRTPRARLKALVRTWARNGELLAGHGCPIGSLTSELGKREDRLHGQAAAVLSGVVGWAQQQFAAMGRRDARELAVALVSAYEGVALLANALMDPGLVATECRRLERWIDSLVS
jgi:TetR/AcrR family transcriptional regulator, transcriptional repressor for nem operon